MFSWKKNLFLLKNPQTRIKLFRIILLKKAVFNKVYFIYIDGCTNSAKMSVNDCLVLKVNFMVNRTQFLYWFEVPAQPVSYAVRQESVFRYSRFLKQAFLHRRFSLLPPVRKMASVLTLTVIIWFFSSTSISCESRSPILTVNLKKQQEYENHTKNRYNHHRPFRIISNWSYQTVIRCEKVIIKSFSICICRSTWNGKNFRPMFAIFRNIVNIRFFVTNKY